MEATSSYRYQAYSLHPKVGAAAGSPTVIPGIPISRNNGANAAGVLCWCTCLVRKANLAVERGPGRYSDQMQSAQVAGSGSGD